MPTAIFVTYCPQGFAIAADGRKRKGEIGNAEIVTDFAQKVFKIESKDYSLAYAMAGFVGISSIETENQVVVDFTSEIEKAATFLKDRSPSNLVSFAEKLCRPVYNALAKAKRQGKIRFPDAPKTQSNLANFSEPGTIICRLLLIGYYKGTASGVAVRFFHEEQTLGDLKPQLIDFRHLTFGYGQGPVNVWRLQSDPADGRWGTQRGVLKLESDRGPVPGQIDVLAFHEKCQAMFVVECKVLGSPYSLKRVRNVVLKLGEMDQEGFHYKLSRKVNWVSTTKEFQNISSTKIVGIVVLDLPMPQTTSGEFSTIDFDLLEEFLETEFQP